MFLHDRCRFYFCKQTVSQLIIVLRLVAIAGLVVIAVLVAVVRLVAVVAVVARPISCKIKIVHLTKSYNQTLDISYIHKYLHVYKFGLELWQCSQIMAYKIARHVVWCPLLEWPFWYPIICIRWLYLIWKSGSRRWNRWNIRWDTIMVVSEITTRDTRTEPISGN